MYWDDILPHASLRASQLLALIRKAAASPSRHAAWVMSGLGLSLTSAYRWLARWKQSTAMLRTRLCQICDPPERSGGEPHPQSLHHLDAAFGSYPCAAAAFHTHFHLPICG